jgi:hypothetical protein
VGSVLSTICACECTDARMHACCVYVVQNHFTLYSCSKITHILLKFCIFEEIHENCILLSFLKISYVKFLHCNSRVSAYFLITKMPSTYVYIPCMSTIDNGIPNNHTNKYNCRIYIVSYKIFLVSPGKLNIQGF